MVIEGKSEIRTSPSFDNHMKSLKYALNDAALPGLYNQPAFAVVEAVACRLPLDTETLAEAVPIASPIVEKSPLRGPAPIFPLKLPDADAENGPYCCEASKLPS